MRIPLRSLRRPESANHALQRTACACHAGYLGSRTAGLRPARSHAPPGLFATRGFCKQSVVSKVRSTVLFVTLYFRNGLVDERRILGMEYQNSELPPGFRYGPESDVRSEVDDLAAVRIPAVIIIMLQRNLLGERGR